GPARVPGCGRASRRRLGDLADLRRRPGARRCRLALARLARPLLPHGNRARAVPAAGPVRGTGRSGAGPRRVQARPPDGDAADRGTPARAREGLDQDRAALMSELLTEERIEELE